MKIIKKIIPVMSLTLLPVDSFAAPVSNDNFFAISAYLGGRISDDLTDTETGEKAKISDDVSQALALSWYYGRNTEGELLFSNSKQNFKISSEGSDVDTDLYINYLHFGGRVNFVDSSPFSTSIGLGIGATFFVPDESQYDTEIVFSGNITGGVRYEINKQWALKGDLRFYGSVLKNNSTLFCSDNQCLIQLDGELYVQTEFMAGIEYKF